MTTSPPKARDRARDALVVGRHQHAVDVRAARRTRSYTRCTMGLPWISERGFPGSRVEPNRAGMIATMAKSKWALV